VPNVGDWPFPLFLGGRQSKAQQTCRGNRSIEIDPKETFCAGAGIVSPSDVEAAMIP
jgi:hypothetical protein